jgi:hypothetical protein
MIRSVLSPKIRGVQAPTDHYPPLRRLIAREKRFLFMNTSRSQIKKNLKKDLIQ